MKEYFTACEQRFPQQRPELRRIFLALRRSGVDTMPELYRMYTRTPEKLLEIRSIGEKSLRLIGELCRQYQITQE